MLLLSLNLLSLLSLCLCVSVPLWLISFREVMNMVCKVCGSELRGNAKFCNKCGVPLSLIERFGAKIAGSKSEMTVVAGQKEDDELPTVDSPVFRKPVAQPPASPTHVTPPATNLTPVTAPPINPTPNPAPP